MGRSKEDIISQLHRLVDAWLDGVEVSDGAAAD